MKVGMILLDPANKYVYEDNSLPVRPDWDKKFITEMIRGRTVLCSMNVIKTIPKSMYSVANFTTDVSRRYDINWGIKTFRDAPDILFVTRSLVTKKLPGKTFRLDEYHLTYKKGQLEIWLLNS
jgi:hypothetical protein